MHVGLMGCVAEKVFHKGSKPVAEHSAQIRTAPFRPHRIAQGFIPVIACGCKKCLANKDYKTYM
jgi:hypothetical protein